MLKERRIRTLFLTLLFFIAPHITNAQTSAATNQQTASTAASVKTETVAFESKLVGVKLPYIVVTPPGYEADNQRRYAVVYLLHGLGGNPRNWIDFNLEAHAARHNFIIISIDGRNGFYTDSATKPNDKFESYIVQELMPDVEKRYRTSGQRAIAGLSMGGYGAIKFALKYPDKFAVAASMSGAVASASWQKPEDLDNRFRGLLAGIFGLADTKTHQDNDLFRVVNTTSINQLARLPFLYLDCGTSDFLFEANRRFANLLTEKKIAHEYRQLPGAHTPAYWRKQLPEVLDVIAREMNGKAMSAVR